jgi:SAGA-associated factor 29
LWGRDEIKVGSQVAFHLPKAKQSDAEWIQCNVIRITGEYSKLRYEVQDPEPDEHGNTSQTYKTNAQSIILIPDDSAGLPGLPPGTMVLARYPETTTFYKAEVITTKVLLPPRPIVLGRLNGAFCAWQRDGTCKLRFEGEEEIGKETDVERRLVLEV